MLINDLVGLLMEVPPVLAASWGAWFFVGLILSIWQRREKARLVVHSASPRQKSGPRTAANAVRTKKHSSGDAFGDLEALLEPQETPSGMHRRPGDDVLAAPRSLP
jgi:hypothetical protein